MLMLIKLSIMSNSIFCLLASYSMLTELIKLLSSVNIIIASHICYRLSGLYNYGHACSARNNITDCGIDLL